ncbi:MAG TPA: hypothetical protein VHE61_01550 [Opitutaceae bacterium]|nr:hypothetical protein [Opitutaceae bacterium]
MLPDLTTLIRQLAGLPGLTFIAVTLLGPGAVATLTRPGSDELAPASPPPCVAREPDPRPDLLEFARRHSLPVHGGSISPAPSSDHRAVLVITRTTGATLDQWLAVLEEHEATAEERRAHPPASFNDFSSTGRILRYATTPTVVQVRWAGPFADGKPAPVALSSPRRVVVAKEHLQLGIARYCEAGIRVATQLQHSDAGRSLYHIGSSHPLTKRQLELGRPFAAWMTAEEEHDTFGASFALKSFLASAQGIPVFDQLLADVMAKPTAWSTLVRFGIVKTFLNYDCREIRLLARVHPAAPETYDLPVRLFLNGRLALNATLSVTTPNGALQVCAGIVAIHAAHPTQPDHRLVVRTLVDGSTVHTPAPLALRR